ncbi:hypothetical protein Y032_0003g1573 [Ancylostoma ceylanicum]|uniref:Uncharacterized protein n=1 Tax=Ancylostoma ceylanicum TaxID=53326 RepID=A0A016VYN5_9BILA|nr:hypothetical protein Y032_0003g1573 [Ancylostoma ceylanicum]
MLASENGVDGGVRCAPRPVAQALLIFSQMRRGILKEECFVYRTVYSTSILDRSFIPPFFQTSWILNF